MADWTDSAMTSCRDRADATWEGEDLTSCRDRVGLFAYGFDDDTHADTGTRAGSSGWTVTVMESVCD